MKKLILIALLLNVACEESKEVKDNSDKVKIIDDSLKDYNFIDTASDTYSYIDVTNESAQLDQRRVDQLNVGKSKYATPDDFDSLNNITKEVFKNGVSSYQLVKTGDSIEIFITITEDQSYNRSYLHDQQYYKHYTRQIVISNRHCKVDMNVPKLINLYDDAEIDAFMHEFDYEITTNIDKDITTLEKLKEEIKKGNETIFQNWTYKETSKMYLDILNNNIFKEHDIIRLACMK